MLFPSSPLLLLGACAGANKPAADDPDDGLPTEDSDTVTGLDTAEATDTDGSFVVKFGSARYKIEQLSVLANATKAPDLDGDGAGDNVVGRVLEALGKNFPGMSLDDVNERIEQLLLYERAIVLMEATHDGAHGLVLDVVLGERQGDRYVGLPGSYDESGVPTERLVGRFTSPDTAVTTEGQLALPLQFYPEDPVILFRGTNVHGEYEINAAMLSGVLGAVFPIDVVMDDVVVPLLEAYDPDAVMIGSLLARRILEDNADQDGGKALSGAFSFAARVAEWDDPDL